MLIQYDTAGGLSLFSSKKAEYNHFEDKYFSPTILTTSLDTTTTRKYNINRILLKIEDQKDKTYIDLYTHEDLPCGGFSKDLNIKLPKLARFPTREQITELPRICLGIRYANLHPIKVPDEDTTIPYETKRKYPNLRFVKSQITKQILVYGDKSNIKRANILTISESKIPTVTTTETVIDPYVAIDLTGQTPLMTGHNCFDTNIEETFDIPTNTSNPPPHCLRYSEYNANQGTTKQSNYTLAH